MDLLPCPFCGGEGSLASGVGEYWGRCMTCDASTAMTSVADPAVTAWNTRTPSETVLIEALKWLLDGRAGARDKAKAALAAAKGEWV